MFKLKAPKFNFSIEDIKTNNNDQTQFKKLQIFSLLCVKTNHTSFLYTTPVFQHDLQGLLFSYYDSCRKRLPYSGHGLHFHPFPLRDCFSFQFEEAVLKPLCQRLCVRNPAACFFANWLSYLWQTDLVLQRND